MTIPTVEWDSIDRESSLGGGGQGSVYGVRVDGREGVLKLEVLPPQVLEAAAAHEALMRPVALVQRNGAVVATVYERCQGVARPVVPPDQVLRIFDALRSLHARGLVHCDVHPGNVLVCRRGLVLGDFGMVRRAGRQVDGRPPARYAAPCQLRAEAAHPAMDIHSWVLTAAHLLTGTRPWDGWSEPRIILAKDADPVPPELPHLARFLTSIPESPGLSWAKEVVDAIVRGA